MMGAVLWLKFLPWLMPFAHFRHSVVVYVHIWHSQKIMLTSEEGQICFIVIGWAVKMIKEHHNFSISYWESNYQILGCRFHLMSCLEFRSMRKPHQPRNAPFQQWVRPVLGWTSQQSIRSWLWRTTEMTKEPMRYLMRWLVVCLALANAYSRGYAKTSLLNLYEFSYLSKSGLNRWEICWRRGSEGTMHFVTKILKLPLTATPRYNFVVVCLFNLYFSCNILCWKYDMKSCANLAIISWENW